MLHNLWVLEANILKATAEIGRITTLIREGKRWTDTVLGHDVQGRDQRIGNVQDLIVDDQTGHVPYLVVNAYEGRSGRRVLLAPSWTHRISWSERTIHMDFSQQMIEDSPAWDRAAPLTRDYEIRLHDYYGRLPYWVRSEGAGTPGHRSTGDSPAVFAVDSL